MSFINTDSDEDWVPGVRATKNLRKQILDDSSVQTTENSDADESFKSASSRSGNGFDVFESSVLEDSQLQRDSVNVTNNCNRNSLLPSDVELCPPSPDHFSRTPSFSKSTDDHPDSLDNTTEEFVGNSDQEDTDVDVLGENEIGPSQTLLVQGEVLPQIQPSPTSSPSSPKHTETGTGSPHYRGLGGIPSELATTSTPFFASTTRPGTHFQDLNLTAIPGFNPNSNLEFTITRKGKTPDSDHSSSSKNQSSRDDDSTPFIARFDARSRALRSQAPATRLPFDNNDDEDDTDVVAQGLQNITVNAAGAGARRRFHFQRREREEDIDIVEIDSEDDEKTDELSANFEFGLESEPRDSGNGDSDIQVLHDNHYNQNQRHRRSSTSSHATEVVNIEDGHSDDDEDLRVITKQVQQIPLGEKQPAAAARKGTILLNELPPIQSGVSGPYNPAKAKNADFFGDVRRTVTKLAETIETMPMSSDNYENVKLPKMAVSLYSHQIYGLQWLSWREREFPGGGILADEMGLGKTIMILALILKSKKEMSQWDGRENSWTDPDDAGDLLQTQTTLVVCPLSCIVQWEKEISSKAGYGSLKVLMFHGPNRTSSARELARADIVLTTYQTIASEIPKDKRSRSPLLRVYWHRIVLDEAHQIRNPATVSALAICQLNARHRWAVTGTPVHNRPQDFFSIAKFLRMTPFDDPKVWDFWIGMKQVRKNEQARERLHILGKALILRRTKQELQAMDAEGEVSKIPPKNIEIVPVELDEEERAVYSHLEQFSKSLFQNFLQNKEERERQIQAAAMADVIRRPKKGGDGGEEVGFMHMFAIICRLRQCAVLPYLIEGMIEDEESDLDDSQLKEDIHNLISKSNPVFAPTYVSSKIRKILEDLEELRQATQKLNNGKMDKVVIVSSWTKLLEILYHHLRARKFSTVFITGKDHVNDRTENMKKFNENPSHPQIVLLSLQAGAVGINLIGGNHVYFVEPHWNPQIELQAQDRVHRFGQKKEVFIRRYISDNTIEQRILELQENKLDLASGILNNVKKRGGGGLNIAQMRLLFEM